jgi:septal ring factor EnvC (AmiA/AmiB activator)
MPYKKVKNEVEELKRELERSPKETGKLEEMLADASETLERYTSEAVLELVQTLKQSASELEVEHPHITSLMNQVMVSLSNLGI